jgi:hypothetical protein
MDTLKLDIAVGLLTRRSKHRVLGPDGEFHWIESEPLLLQLQMAIGNSSAAPTFKASGGNPIPISADALDLMTQIRDTVEDHWWWTHSLHKGAGEGTIAGRLRAWAMAARADRTLYPEAEKTICAWVTQIERLFNPQRRWEIRGTCPECNVQKVGSSIDEDGHVVMKHALAVVYDDDHNLAGAECAGCNHKWAPDEVKMLAREIAKVNSIEVRNADPS